MREVAMIDKKKILIIKSSRDDFEEFYNLNIYKEGVEIWDSGKVHSENSHNFITSQIIIGYSFIKNMYFTKISNYSLIIIFDDSWLIPWVYMFKKKNTKIILWKWNVSGSFMGTWAKKIKKLCEVWTFDAEDAYRYGFNLNRQFYFYPKMNEGISHLIENNNSKIIFFVGKDKNRYHCIKNIKNIIEERNFIGDFWLVKDENTKYSEMDVWIKSEPMKYSEVIAHVIKCGAILDIVQNGQKGFTVRVLEAIFYEKKLFTNNKEILNSDIYSSNNIFIIDYDDWNTLNDFWERPYQKLPPNILEQYAFDKWLENFG